MEVYQLGGEGVGSERGRRLQQAVQRGKAALPKQLAGQRRHQAPVAPECKARHWCSQPQQLQAGSSTQQAHC